MDVSDIVEYNVGLLNPNDLTNSYFCLSKNDPTAGFSFDASQVAGHTYPETPTDTSGKLYGCVLPAGAYSGAQQKRFDLLIRFPVSLDQAE